MFLQYDTARTSTPNDQPQSVRKLIELKSHPTLLKRASLGDTKGAVFLPCSERSPSETPAEPANLRCFRPGLHRTASHDITLAAPRAMGVGGYSELPGASQSPLSSLKRKVYQRRPQGLIQSLSEPVLTGSIDSRISLTVPTMALPRPTTPLSVALSEEDDKKALIGIDGAQESSNNSTLDTQCDSSPEAPVSFATDGAGDQFSPRRRSSFNCDRPSTNATRLVRFASNLNMAVEDEDPDEQPTPELHHLHQDTPTTSFRNPFREDSNVESRRSSDASSDASSYLRANAFSGHRDTLARITHRAKKGYTAELEPRSSSSSGPPSPVLVQPSTLYTHEPFNHIHFGQRIRPYNPSTIIQQIVHYLPFQDYLSLRSTCRQWCRALPEPQMPGSYRIPREVLQQVLSLLNPCDFDAARHTCRKWFDAGLDAQLLRLMLRSAQCQNAFKSDTRKRQDSLVPGNPVLPVCVLAGEDGHPVVLAAPPTMKGSMSKEWLMSKRLATATRLSVDWRGSWSRTSITEATSRFYVVEQVNFQRILVSLSSLDTVSHDKTFTVSTCGRYLLVTSGNDCFVYNLHGKEDTLIAVVRLSADCSILRVSMDTSSGRYAVAALLSNRTGVIWDLTSNHQASQSCFPSGEPMDLGMKTEVHGTGVHDRAETTNVSGNLPLRRSEVIPEATPTMPRNSVYDRAARHSLDLGGHNQLLEPFLDASLCATPESEAAPPGPSTGIVIQARPAATFYHLGNADDAPRSVAICPSRKCVAFGCRLGIELHWVDALTGGDLNRWFPLAAPSDHLYFLPQRAGLDSSKKLRLISSAAGPATPSTNRSESLPARLVRAKTHDRGRRQSMTRLFFGNLPFPAAAVFPNNRRTGSAVPDEDQHGVLRAVDCDHYQAVPLSDGHHMLYTDPTDGSLCLGSDAPLGGPTKLIRKVVFVPPTVADDGWASLMSCYTAGQDLEWGVRIVAAHRDGRLILYNVPADIFSHIRHLCSAPDVWDEGAGVIAQSDVLMDDVLSAHPNTWSDLIMANAAARSEFFENPLRTVQIMGVEIGHVGRDIVDDVAVNTSHGGVRVWVFCRSGLARLLDIYVNSDHLIRQRFVGSDGLPYETQAQQDHADDEGHRSPKGNERAPDDVIDDMSSIKNPMALDGASDEMEQELNIVNNPHSSGEQEAYNRLCRVPEAVHLEILSSARSIMEDSQGPFQIEILTDWRDEWLLAPYVVILG